VDGIIDSFFGALPVIFIVIWVLRLISRRKDKIKKSDAEQTVQQPEPQEKLDPIAAVPAEVVKPVVDNQVHRIVADSVTPEECNPVSAETGPFENLSPLARGMVWSFILDKPLSLKEPDY